MKEIKNNKGELKEHEWEERSDTKMFKGNHKASKK